MADGTAKPVIFISYSHLDEPERTPEGDIHWLTDIQAYLAPAAKGIFELWTDEDMTSGADWEKEIKNKLAVCDICILFVSRHSLASRFVIEVEIATILERQRKGHNVQIYPIVLSPFPQAAAPASLLALNLRPRLDKPLFGFSRHERGVAIAKIADEIVRLLGKKVTAVAATTTERPKPQSNVHITGLPETAYERLVGRDEELKRLDDAWADTKTSIVSLVAEGGAGKSALLNEWLKRLQVDDYRGAEMVLGWSFYSQGTKERATSADAFLNWALDKLDIKLETTSTIAKGEAVAEAMRQRRVLLVLDGVEPLQHGLDTQFGLLKDQGLRALLRRFAATPVPTDGLVVLTTRLAVKDITRWQDGAGPVLDVDRLSDEAGSALLRDNGVWGTNNDLKAAAHDFGGHPLALGLLASFLKETQAGDVRRRDHVRAYFADKDNPRHDHAKRVMESYEKEWLAGQPALLAIMHMVGLFDGPASGDCLSALRAKPAISGFTDQIVKLDEGEWQRAIARLRDVRLLAPPDPAAPDSLDAHPLVREWYGERLKETNDTGWKAAHGRLYEHLRDTTKEGITPTLVELAPLYQAITHGCRAGQHQEVLEKIYINRICRRGLDGQIEFRSTTKLGGHARDLAVISWFFDRPYDTPIKALSELYQNWLLSTVSTLLRTRGRLSEALLAQRSALHMNEAAKRWSNAAISACNLSRAELLVGEVRAAVTSAVKSVEHADFSGDRFWMMAARTVHADALHAAGQRAQAEDLFADAERRQQQWQHKYPLLYSMQGYDYCELLLANGNSNTVRDRATQTLAWVSSEKLLLNIALDTLNIGRAHFEQALANALLGQKEAARDDACTASVQLDRAVEGLRASDDSNYIPRGLLARAAFRRNVGDWDGATRDFEEIEEIAEPGPMRLYLCDMALERTRLALAKIEAFAPINGMLEANNFPKPTVPSPEEITELKIEAGKQLRIAADYIEKCGYHRRDEELAELQAVLGGERTLANSVRKTKTGNVQKVQAARVEGSNQEEWLKQTVDFAEICVVRQFGHQAELAHFSRAIWNRISVDQNQTIYLSDIQAAAAEASCSTQNALAVLALLSSRSVRLLNMEMRSTSPDGTRISQTEFIQKLSDWWRDKKLSDAEWRRWASKIEVKWISTRLNGEMT